VTRRGDHTAREPDLVSVVESPDLAAITRVSVELGSRESVKIQTLSALTIDEFVKAME